MLRQKKYVGKFVMEYHMDKPVTAMRGVDYILAQRLVEAGYHCAHELFGRFLFMNKDRRCFMLWMHSMFGASAKQAAECYQWLDDWFSQFV